MVEMLETNWLLVLIAFLIGLAIAWYVFRVNRKTRVRGTGGDVLDEGAERAQRNSALVDAPPAAARDPSATPVGTTATEGDDLTRIKGLGPKLATRLNDLGVTRFDQIAAWDDAEMDRIDSQLRRFEGRIRRDDWPGQARLLATGDAMQFKQKYGAGG